MHVLLRVFFLRPQFSTLYIVSFLVITVGFVMFNAAPTYSALAESGSGSDEDDGGADLTAESSSDRRMSAGGDTPGAETLPAAL